MKRFLLYIAIWTLLFSACQEEELLENNTLQFHVANTSWQNSRAQTRTTTWPNHEAPKGYPTQLTVFPYNNQSVKQSNFTISHTNPKHTENWEPYHSSTFALQRDEIEGWTFYIYNPNIDNKEGDAWIATIPLFDTRDFCYTPYAATLDFESYHINFQMRHTQAMLRFWVGVAEKNSAPQYGDIRNIKLTEFKVTPIINNIIQTEQAFLAESKAIDKYVTPDGILPLTLYINPTVLNTYKANSQNVSISLDITYDVYDMDNLLTREGCQASALLNISNPPSGNLTAAFPTVGYYFDYNILVDPHFLYVLSDNDDKADLVIR